MKTKSVEYFVDLVPGWQDNNCAPCLSPTVYGNLQTGFKRIKIVVELPCFGGSLDITQTIGSVSKEVPSGFQQ